MFYFNEMQSVYPISKLNNQKYHDSLDSLVTSFAILIVLQIQIS